MREVAEDAAASGALWIEPALSLGLYAERFGGLESTLKVLVRAAAAAEEATGVGLGYIVAAERSLPGCEVEALAREAEALARAVRSVVDGGCADVRGHPGIVGFGLHGAEPGNPPEPFAQAFAIACAGGVLAAVPHAGELAPSPGGGPASVRFCVDGLGAQRVEHGVLAVEDPTLVEHLAAKKVCLDVCPTSNYLLRVVDALAEHPLPRLLRAGVPCTINSDDPLLFGASLLEEYQHCLEELGLSEAELADCARSSFRHSRAPEELKQRGMEGIEAWLAKRHCSGEERGV